MQRYRSPGLALRNDTLEKQRWKFHFNRNQTSRKIPTRHGLSIPHDSPILNNSRPSARSVVRNDSSSKDYRASSSDIFIFDITNSPCFCIIVSSGSRWRYACIARDRARCVLGVRNELAHVTSCGRVHVHGTRRPLPLSADPHRSGGSLSLFLSLSLSLFPLLASPCLSLPRFVSSRLASAGAVLSVSSLIYISRQWDTTNTWILSTAECRGAISIAARPRARRLVTAADAVDARGCPKTLGSVWPHACGHMTHSYAMSDRSMLISCHFFSLAA